MPDGTRDVATGELIHDDLIVSSAQCAILDEQTWGLTNSEVLQGINPRVDMGDAY